MDMRETGEFGFIDSIAGDTIYDASTVKVGIGDDCAVYATREDSDQLMTTDMMVEGIHFSGETMRPFDVGYRLGAANLSDIAAMGGRPRQATVAVAVPETYRTEDLIEIYEGLKAICGRYKVNIVGGDTVKTEGPLVLSVTVTGDVPKGEAVLRNGARRGDLVGVSGYPGSSSSGLAVILRKEEADYPFSVAAHRRPEPRVAAGNALRKAGVTSMNDVSDGLARELNEIAFASGAELMIEEERIPLHEETRRIGGADALRHAWNGGEDFELVFTIGEDAWNRMPEEEKYAFGLTVIGRVLSRRVDESASGATADESFVGVRARSKDGNVRVVEVTGYAHFG